MISRQLPQKPLVFRELHSGSCYETCSRCSKAIVGYHGSVSSFSVLSFVRLLTPRQLSIATSTTFFLAARTTTEYDELSRVVTSGTQQRRTLKKVTKRLSRGKLAFSPSPFLSFRSRLTSGSYIALPSSFILRRPSSIEHPNGVSITN